MAIKKKITFEGNTYNLGNKDRVGAQAAWDLDGPLRSFTYLEKELAFAGGYDPEGLTVQTQWEDADVEGGNTLAINSVYDWDWDSATAVDVYLPAATKNAYIVVRMVEPADGGENLVITTNGTDVYAEDLIVKCGTGLAAACDVSAGSGDNILTIGTDASNNGWGETGSSIVFFCKDTGSWLVKLYGVTKGTGAASTVAFS